MWNARQVIDSLYCSQDIPLQPPPFPSILLSFPSSLPMTLCMHLFSFLSLFFPPSSYLSPFLPSLLLVPFLVPFLPFLPSLVPCPFLLYPSALPSLSIFLFANISLPWGEIDYLSPEFSSKT